MTVKSAQSWSGTFVTLDSTGALAAGTPSGVLYVDGTANAATVTITGTNPYKYAVTLPSLTAGQRVDMYITATIATIATAGIVASAQADTVLLSDGVTLADDAITASKYDESTAFPVKSADTGATAIARMGADSDTLETLSDQLDAAATASALTTLDGKVDTIDNFIDTEIAAIITHLTDIKGAGWTTETLAALDALIDGIKAKTDQLTFTTPNKVDATADVVLSPEAIEGMATAIRDGLPEDIWSSSIRTLTQSPAEIVATVLGADITQIRGDSWAVQLTGVELGSIQQLAIKHSAKQSDSAALLFVDSVNGLTVLNGVAQDGEDSSKASLTYDGTILTLTVDASITAQLPAGSLQYGVQSISNNGIVSEPYGGTFRVLADIVRATD